MARVKLGERLAMLLANLITGDKLYIHDLAEECGASVKTLQRDLSSLSYHLPINREKGYYWMTPATKGQYNLSALRQLIHTLGLSEEFPSLDNRLLSYLLLPEHESPFLMKSKDHEPSSQYSEVFKLLSSAIVNRQVINFTFHEHSYQNVEPYKLISNREVWHLAMRYKNQLRYLRVSDIRFVRLTPEQYTIDKRVLEEIKQQDFC